MSNSLWSHGLQHARLPCPSPTLGVDSNSSPKSWWYHLTISSSAIPFSSCLQSFPASGSFQMSQLFTSGGQRMRVSASASVLLVNIQDWFPLGSTGWISHWNNVIKVDHKVQVRLGCSVCRVIYSFDHPWLYWAQESDAGSRKIEGHGVWPGACSWPTPLVRWMELWVESESPGRRDGSSEDQGVFLPTSGTNTAISLGHHLPPTSVHV